MRCPVNRKYDTQTSEGVELVEVTHYKNSPGPSDTVMVDPIEVLHRMAERGHGNKVFNRTLFELFFNNKPKNKQADEQ